MNTLEEICSHKLQHIAKQKKKLGLAHLEQVAKHEASTPRGFIKALKDKQSKKLFGLIAELKKASPSKGLIRAEFAPEKLARDYAEGGAACLSVLTDEPYFQGADEYLKIARAAVKLPVLRKDFMLDPYQIVESRALGADAILLIVAALGNSQAAELEAAAIEYGMDILVEVHDEKETERALKYLKSQLIGVNNRDLKTLKVDIKNSARLSQLIPPNYVKVCESGIKTHDDLKKMREFGFNSFLVGETLMSQADVKMATSNLLGL